MSRWTQLPRLSRLWLLLVLLTCGWSDARTATAATATTRFAEPQPQNVAPSPFLQKEKDDSTRDETAVVMEAPPTESPFVIVRKRADLLGETTVSMRRCLSY